MIEGKPGVVPAQMFNLLTSNLQRLTLERIRRPASPRFYCPFPATLFPSLVASASVMYLPFLVVP